MNEYMLYTSNMHIVIATPLYPPDIEESAIYVKELAKRLSKTNIITIVTYGYMPEKIHNVNIITIDKRKPTLLRLISFTRALYRTSLIADIVYLQNGLSTELPFLLMSSFNKIPSMFGVSDKKAFTYSKKHLLAHLLNKSITARTNSTISNFPLTRPEILPFEQMPKKSFRLYENSWETHIKQIHRILDHVV